MIGAAERGGQHLVEGAIGSLIGVAAPADIGKEERGLPHPPETIGIVRKQWIGPLHHLIGMGRRAGLPPVHRGGKFDQRVLAPFFRRQARMQQPFTQTIGGNHHIFQIAPEQQPLQHHGAIGQRLGAAARNDLHPLQ